MLVNPRARAVWARTRLRVWPESYVLASVPLSELGRAAQLIAGTGNTFAALVQERDEVSVTVLASLWTKSPLRASARAEDGPYRVLSLDVDVDLDLCGFLAPAAERLAEAGVPIIPQCAYLKDHLLIHEEHLRLAQAELEELIAWAQR